MTVNRSNIEHRTLNIELPPILEHQTALQKLAKKSEERPVCRIGVGSCVSFFGNFVRSELGNPNVS